MRVTRAASRAEHAQHPDEDTNDASVPHAEAQDRVPLGEVSANTAIDPDSTDVPAKKMAVKKGKAKGAAKKGAKGKKTKAAQDDDADPSPPLDDEHSATENPTSDATAQELQDEPIAGACHQMLATHNRLKMRC